MRHSLQKLGLSIQSYKHTCGRIQPTLPGTEDASCSTTSYCPIYLVSPVLVRHWLGTASPSRYIHRLRAIKRYIWADTIQKIGVPAGY